MSTTSVEVASTANSPLSALERDARARARRVLRWGASGTTLLSVLPGMLSDSPAHNALTGAGVGLAATLLTAAGAYLWRSYVTPYWHIRTMIEQDALRTRAGASRAVDRPEGHLEDR